MEHGMRCVAVTRPARDSAPGEGIKPAPRKKGPVKKPPDKPLPMPDTVPWTYAASASRV